MQTVPIKLVTIVAENILADRLVRDILAAGATGYTITAANGAGSRDLRASTLGGENVRIETLVVPRIAEVLLEQLAKDWFPDYAVIAWVTTVDVIRGQKYAAGPSPGP